MDVYERDAARRARLAAEAREEEKPYVSHNVPLEKPPQPLPAAEGEEAKVWMVWRFCFHARLLKVHGVGSKAEEHSKSLSVVEGHSWPPPAPPIVVTGNLLSPSCEPFQVRCERSWRNSSAV